jgi:alpha-1,2-mannosyltransferase
MISYILPKGEPMNIAIVHHSLNMLGGAERLCLSTIEALRRRGQDVSLITVEKTDWQRVRKNFGVVSFPTKEHYLTSSRISGKLSDISISSTYFSAYTLQLLACKSSRKYDLVMNTFGDAVNSIADVSYVHFPLRAASSMSQIPAFTSRTMWDALAPLYRSSMSMIDRIAPSNLLTNSRFVQTIISKVLHRKSLVIYPPVDVQVFAQNFQRNEKESSTVVAVSSYTPKRHLEQLPLIAKHSKQAKFVLMGKADEYSTSILAALKRSAKQLQVEDRIIMLQNVPLKELTRTLSEAKVYLHMMPQDHFGISVVEAMASGCVPVVHKSGGPWIDILDQQQGTYGFSYSNPTEAAKYIDMLVTREDLRSKIALRASERARLFDKTVFMNRIAEVVERIAA